MSLKFADGTEYEDVIGNSPSNITIVLGEYQELQGLEEAIQTPGNLDRVEINGTVYEHLKTLGEHYFTVIRKSGKLHVIFTLCQKTATEIAVEQEKKEIEQQKDSVDTAMTYLTDQQALTVKRLHKHWNDDPDGYHYSMDNPEDRRRQHNDGLWKLQKDHDKQASWFPGSDPTLWVQIVEGHAGTLEDPIPVPDSVTTSGFEYVYGKYYSESDTIYLCQRQGIEDPESMYGQTEKLYAAPSALVGQYFIVAE